MLDKAIRSEPLAFEGFDRTKNVQDQLQEIYRQSLPTEIHRESLNVYYNILTHFWLWNRDEGSSDGTMEQRWLAFVMQEKYNKVWAGKEWEIKEEEKRNVKK